MWSFSLCSWKPPSQRWLKYCLGSGDSTLTSGLMRDLAHKRSDLSLVHGGGGGCSEPGERGSGCCERGVGVKARVLAGAVVGVEEELGKVSRTEERTDATACGRTH